MLFFVWNVCACLCFVLEFHQPISHYRMATVTVSPSDLKTAAGYLLWSLHSSNFALVSMELYHMYYTGERVLCFAFIYCGVEAAAVRNGKAVVLFLSV